MKDKEKFLKSMGHNIHLARLNKSITQDVLAKHCNVSPKYISALERGLSSGSIELILDICDYLDVTPNFIFNNAINIDEKKDNINFLSQETLITFSKLKDENKEFVNHIITHLYNMQKKR